MATSPKQKKIVYVRTGNKAKNEQRTAYTIPNVFSHFFVWRREQLLCKFCGLLFSQHFQHLSNALYARFFAGIIYWISYWTQCDRERLNTKCVSKWVYLQLVWFLYFTVCVLASWHCYCCCCCSPFLINLKNFLEFIIWHYCWRGISITIADAVRS